MIEDMKVLYRRLAEREPRHPIERDIDRRVEQLISEVRRVRPDTWEAEVAAVIGGVAR